jgi:Ala-tRNA(Pro) deacylase
MGAAMNISDFLEEKRCHFERMPHAPAFTSERMAHELHVTGNEVAKTVLLCADGGYCFVVAILPATKKLDIDCASKLLGGTKLRLAEKHEITEHCPDCEFGILPPFGSRYKMQTIVDASLAENEEIVFEGNTHDEAIRMKFEEFRRLEEPLVAPITVRENTPEKPIRKRK